MLRREQEAKILLSRISLREQNYCKGCMAVYMQRSVTYVNDKVLTKTVARVCLGTDKTT